MEGLSEVGGHCLSWAGLSLPPQESTCCHWSSCLSCADSQVFSWLCLSESRCDKDLDTLSGYALCLPNLARLQTYHFAEHRPILCVEIKVNLHQGEDVGEGERGSVSLCLECTLQQKLLGSPCWALRPLPGPQLPSIQLASCSSMSVTCTLLLWVPPLDRASALGPFLVLARGAGRGLPQKELCWVLPSLFSWEDAARQAPSSPPSKPCPLAAW